MFYQRKRENQGKPERWRCWEERTTAQSSLRPKALAIEEATYPKTVILSLSKDLSPTPPNAFLSNSFDLAKVARRLPPDSFACRVIVEVVTMR
jgi:hypothetical protein